MIAVNKMDLAIASPVLPDEISREQILYVSAAAGTHIHELKELLAKQLGQTAKNPKNRGRSHPSRRLCRAGHSH